MEDMMAELTARQQQKIEIAVAEAMSEDDSPQMGRATALDPGDLKKAFCENWDKVKKALQFIASLPVVPQEIKDAIAKIIRIGDRIKAIVCG
jgi:hypothetical protein